MEGDTNRLKRGMVSVLIANTLNLVLNVLTSFLLPKYLSVATYAAIKTYKLYLSYVGVLSLGYIDGMFLKYGGLEPGQLDQKDLGCDLSTFRLFQLAMVALALALGLWMGDPVFLAFVLVALPANMAGYFRTLYQAIGAFRRYGRIMNLTASAIFACDLALLFVLRTDRYSLYLTVDVLVHLAVWLWLEQSLRRVLPGGLPWSGFSLRVLAQNIRDGFLLLLGNLSNLLLTGMDRWFVKALLDTLAFAQYSFACSMESFVNVAITPLTVTLYHYFCRVSDSVQIRKLRAWSMLLGSVLLAAAFPGKLVLELYLDKYLGASQVMFYLFDAQLFYLIIKGIYVNLYKARHRQARYFLRLVTVIAAGFAFNAVGYWLYPHKEAFAVGTLLSSILWLVLCAVDFRELPYCWNELAYLAVIAVGFLLCGNGFSAILGGLLYVLLAAAASLTLMRRETMALLSLGLQTLRKRLKGRSG